MYNIRGEEGGVRVFMFFLGLGRFPGFSEFFVLF